ncbi:MAG: ADOP family duplicated permease [Vicinamibacteria bacterium]|nr:ADOP family duplicated permease [Vicinamibacteria bacterium]
MLDRIRRLGDAALEDLRYALRGLGRSPGFTATVVTTLGLGMGANLAMFDVVDRLMFRPLAYLKSPGEVHRFYLQWQSRGATVTGTSGPYARLVDFQKWTTSFERFAGFSERELAVGVGEATRDRRIAAVSASYFDFFDARPALGRFFVASEDTTPKGADVVVLSDAFWKSEFGGADVLGARLRVGNIDASIIGVAPSGFDGVNDAVPPVAYVPITTFAGSTGTNDAMTYYSSYKWGFMHIMARRRPGVTLDAATADATQAFRQSWAAAGPDNPLKDAADVARPRVVLSSLRPGNGPDPAIETRTAFWILIVSAIVLLIAGANVANLMLARTLDRHRETAVRLALGVSRQRLVVQGVVENLLLAAFGGAAALLVARTGGVLVQGVLMRTPISSTTLLPDPRVLIAALGLTVVAGVLLGVVPGALIDKGDISRTLRGGARAGRPADSRLRSGLLIAQAALSVILLVGATLFVRSLAAVSTMRMGYDVDRVLHVSRVIRGPRPDEDALKALHETLMTTARSLPGVESAAWVSSAPFISTSNTDLFVEGVESTRALGTFTYQATTSDYFKTMGTRILRGRGITDEDRKDAPNVAVVSESMARVLWPGRDAIGQCMRVFAESAPCATVVGVAEDMVQREIAGPERYHYYMPIDQFTRTSGNGMLLRLTGDPGREAESIRKALQRVIPGDSYVVTRPLRGIVEDATRSWRVGATMFTAFGFLALAVAAVGLYGAISYRVNGQAGEMGVRVALGAQRRDLMRLIVGHAARIGASGVVVGSAVALAASRWIQPLLFRQSAIDPMVYAAVGIAMVAVAVAASALPALRAAKADPNTVLRAE